MLCKPKNKKMKIITFAAIIIAATVGVFFSCNANQSADNYLENTIHRRDIISAFVHNEGYSIEMIHEMMNNDSCRQIIKETIIRDKGVLTKNKTIQASMLSQLLDLADRNSSVTNK